MRFYVTRSHVLLCAPPRHFSSHDGRAANRYILAGCRGYLIGTHIHILTCRLAGEGGCLSGYVVV